ncbi:MAG: transposase, partial [Gemmatimonadetes bacterium]
KEQDETIPNQIKQPTQTPTLRWVFQLMEGINRVILNIDGNIQVVIEGVTEIREKIIRLFGPEVLKIYQLEPT